MKIQFIYSFENEPQQIVTLPFSESFLHSGKDALIDFALSDLTEDEFVLLCKQVLENHNYKVTK